MGCASPGLRRGRGARRPRLAAILAAGAAAAASAALGGGEVLRLWAAPSSQPPLRRQARGALAAVAAETVGAEALAERQDSAADFLLPIGPSCPFRSSFMETRSLDNALASIVEESTTMNVEFSQMAAAVMAGIAPDKEKSRRIGGEMKQYGMKLRAVLDELENSKDFQAMEAYQTMQIMSQRINMPSFRSIELLMNWQAEGLVAVADEGPLPPMPPGLDPNVLQNTPGAISPANANPATRPSLDMRMPRLLPFTEAEFDAVGGQQAMLLKAEFERLCRDHTQLVGLGETYGDFDAAGKEFYLGQMGQIAFRWEELIDNAQMAGISVNSAFRSMSESYLARSQIDPDDFRTVVEDVHDFFQRQVDMEKGVGA